MYLHKLFFILIFLALEAQSYTHALAPNINFDLDSNTWTLGSGSFTGSQTAQIHLYSSKKFKDLQLTFEDLMILKKNLLTRLPPQCQIKKNLVLEAKKHVCLFEEEIASSGRKSLTAIAFFETKTKEVYRVRSTYLIGTSRNVLPYIKEIRQSLSQFENLSSFK